MKSYSKISSLIWLLITLGLISMPIAAEVLTKSAGVSLEDRIEDPSYSLKLVFFETGGPYVADVNVAIYDLNNKLIVKKQSHGPWFYVGLPSGKYRIEATRGDGQIQGAEVTLANEQSEIGLVFEER